VLGLHRQLPIVYVTFAAIVCLGFLQRERKIGFGTLGVTLLGSVLFFVTTNFGVWAFDAMYPRTAAGLVECYTAAIPFFGNTALGDLFYTAVLFGGLALAESKFARLRESAMANAV